MRLDHLLSKESTARFLREFGDTPTSITGQSASGPFRPPQPRAEGTTGNPVVRRARHCSVLREWCDGSAVAATSEVQPVDAPTRSGAHGDLIGALRTAERARASSKQCKKKSQAMKSQRWMPWRQMPMKDVGGCEKPRGAADQALIRGYPNGETRLGSCPVTAARTHTAVEGTGGTETSQYPEEEKTTVIP